MDCKTDFEQCNMQEGLRPNLCKFCVANDHQRQIHKEITFRSTKTTFSGNKLTE